jgi:hypothetical protein
MRTLLVAVLALILGFFVARSLWRAPDTDPIQVILTQVKTQAIIEHERQVAIWYRVCPEVIGINPEIFVAWPGKLSYELDLANVEIERRGDALVVRAGAIRADEPAVPTDFIDYLTTSPWFNLANEQALVNDEIAKASPIARWLTAYYQKNDSTLVQDFREELAALVTRLAGALGVTVSGVEVEIADAEVDFPKLPKLELCAGSTAAVNGTPFAKVEDGYTIPFRFKPPGESKSAARGVIAPVAGGRASAPGAGAGATR